MERDTAFNYKDYPEYISTHTLTWSVTYLSDEEILANRISTHTLTWSVTCNKVTKFSEQVNFNSHAHVERDLNTLSLRIIQIISTHTLTWSVTIF